VVEEWGPRGRHVTTLTFDLPCSPCHTDAVTDCINEHACMVAMTPEIVFQHVVAALGAPAG
jgi:hypothetical protein